MADDGGPTVACGLTILHRTFLAGHSRRARSQASQLAGRVAQAPPAHGHAHTRGRACGYSSRVADSSVLPLPDPVRLTGHELGDESIPTEELRTRALEHARRYVQGHAVVNAQTRWHISVGRRGVNKTLNHGARREHVQSVPALLALLALLERATLVFSEANRDAGEARNIPHVHTFVGTLVLGGATAGTGAVLYRVRLIVKETNEGYRFYDHDQSEPPLAGAAAPEELPAAPASPV